MRESKVIIVAFFAGLAGGLVPKLFFADGVAIAQSAQSGGLDKDRAAISKLIRAERIELVNNQGVPLAVFSVTYSNAIPAGSPQLTLSDRDEVLHRVRQVELTNAGLQIHNGYDEWLTLGTGSGLTFRDSTGMAGIGLLPRAIPGGGMSHIVTVLDSTGMAELTGQGLTITDKDGHPVLALPR